MLHIVLATPAFVVPPVVPAAEMHTIVQQRAPIMEPSLPTPFLLAKEGIPKVQYDYTRGLEDLNGIDIWADIPTSSEVNRAKGTDKVYQKTVKALVAPIGNAPEEPPPGYKTIAEEIEEDKKRLAAEAAAAANAPKKAEKACFYCLEEFKK